MFKINNKIMQIIEAPGVYKSLPIDDKKIIFLAGSIEMGSAENWQEEIIEVIKQSYLNTESTIILNPRRKSWNSSWEQGIKNSYFREQVEWELAGIQDANITIFYFDPATKSPITLMELGTMSDKGDKAIVCCPDGYWKKGNVEVFCEWNSIELHHTKESLIDDLNNMTWN